MDAIEADPEGTTLLDIQLSSGFNTKSVFNTAFKKHTGLTPSAYRKKCINNQSPEFVQN